MPSNDDVRLAGAGVQKFTFFRLLRTNFGIIQARESMSRRGARCSAYSGFGADRQRHCLHRRPGGAVFSKQRESKARMITKGRQVERIAMLQFCPRNDHKWALKSAHDEFVIQPLAGIFAGLYFGAQPVFE